MLINEGASLNNETTDIQYSVNLIGTISSLELFLFVHVALERSLKERGQRLKQTWCELEQ